MLVIADASPLHYLILIASTDILPTLFGSIIIPRTVAEELQYPRTPAAVREWMVAPPAWLDVQDVRMAPDATLAHLDPGERDAIALAQELQADLLLMDEWAGRRAAERRALTVTGVLGVLERAAQQELLDISIALTRLQATDFYAPANFVRDMLTRAATRKSRPPS